MIDSLLERINNLRIEADNLEISLMGIYAFIERLEVEVRELDAGAQVDKSLKD